VVLDGTDNFATGYNASWACGVLGSAHEWASIVGFGAQRTVFYADHGAIYEGLFPVPPAPGAVPSCVQAGALGPAVGVAGSATALEAMNLVTGVGTPLIGKFGYFTALEGIWEYIPLVGNPEVVQQVREHGPTQGAEAFEEPPAADDSVPTVAEVDEIPENALVMDVGNTDEVEIFGSTGTVRYTLTSIISG